MKNRTWLLPSKLIPSNGHSVTDEETIAKKSNIAILLILGNQWLMQ